MVLMVQSPYVFSTTEVNLDAYTYRGFYVRIILWEKYFYAVLKRENENFGYITYSSETLQEAYEVAAISADFIISSALWDVNLRSLLGLGMEEPFKDIKDSFIRWDVVESELGVEDSFHWDLVAIKSSYRGALVMSSMASNQQLPRVLVSSRTVKGWLYLEDGEVLQVDSNAWHEWLERHSNSTFRFDSVYSDNDSFTAWKRKQDTSAFWYAYKMFSGKVRNVYLGKSEALTVAKMLSAAVKLQSGTTSKLDTPAYTPQGTTQQEAKTSSQLKIDKALEGARAEKASTLEADETPGLNADTINTDVKSQLESLQIETSYLLTENPKLQALINCLANNQWEEASRITESLESSEKLSILDELWTKFSNGRFGFSIQKQIWQQVGGYITSSLDTYGAGWKTGDSDVEEKKYNTFLARVGCLESLTSVLAHHMGTYLG